MTYISGSKPTLRKTYLRRHTQFQIQRNTQTHAVHLHTDIWIHRHIPKCASINTHTLSRKHVSHAGEPHGHTICLSTGNHIECVPWPSETRDSYKKMPAAALSSYLSFLHYIHHRDWRLMKYPDVYSGKLTTLTYCLIYDPSHNQSPTSSAIACWAKA